MSNSTMFKRIRRALLVLFGKDPWVNLEVGVSGSRILVITDEPELWSTYAANRRKIDFGGSFLRSPNMDFYFTFNFEFESLDFEECLKAIPPYYLKCTTPLFGTFRSLLHVKSWLEIHKQSKVLTDCIVKYKDNIEADDWRVIFEVVPFKTLDLLNLEQDVLKNLKVVCEYQTLNPLLEQRWSDQPDFYIPGNENETTISEESIEDRPWTPLMVRDAI